MATSFLANTIIRSSVARGLGWTFAAHYAKLYDPSYIGSEFADAYGRQVDIHTSTLALAELASDSYLSSREIAVVPFKMDNRFHLFGRVEFFNPQTGEQYSYPQHVYTNQVLTKEGYEGLLAEGYRRGDPGQPKCGYLDPGVVWNFTLVTVEENEGWLPSEEEEEDLPF